MPLFLKMLRSEAKDDAARIAAVLAGVRRYQDAPRREILHAARPTAQVGRVRLLDYSAENASGPPIVFVPSLINGPEILDIDSDRSLMMWLAEQGFRTLLVDWGSPGADEAALDLGGHITHLLNPLLQTLSEPAILVGYCLGGTLAMASALTQPARALAMIAAPWKYDAFPSSALDAMDALWMKAEPQARAIGLLPMEVLQLVFWQLDPRRTLDKFDRFGRSKDPKAEAQFVPVEDWANAGPPMPYAAARELMDDFFAANLTGNGRWRIDGRAIRPEDVTVPTLQIVSTTDRIVPAAAAADVGERLSLALGHVGMIVGGQGRQAVWEPLAEWLRRVSC